MRLFVASQGAAGRSASRCGGGRSSRRPLRRCAGALLLPTAVGLLLEAGWAVTAAAQTAKQEAVMGRARPDFDPIGIEIFFDEEQPGPPITVFPILQLDGGYDTNVFRTSDDAEADFFWEISPKLRIANAGQDLGLEAGLSATVRRNLEFESNDFEDYDAYGQATYFFMEDSDVTVQMGYSRLHEDRSDPDSTGPGENIIQYDRYRALIFSRNSFSDFLVNPQIEYYYYDYQGGDDQDDRDHWEGLARVRLGYEFEPGMVAFVEPGANLRRYNQPADDFGFSRDSWGWTIVGGLSYDVSAVTSAEIFAGYFQQDYEDPELADAGGLTYGAALTWNPFDTITVNGSVQRMVQESTLSGVSGTVVTMYTLGVDYELDDNLMITTLGGVTTSSFKGSDRDDFSYNFGGGLVYLINEYSRARIGGRYEARDSNLDSNDYDAMILEARLTLQY